MKFCTLAPIVMVFCCYRYLTTKVVAADEPSVACAATDDIWSASYSSESQRCSHSANTSVNDLPMKHFSWISHFAPQFEVDGNSIHILSEPSDYYETLKVCL